MILSNTQALNNQLGLNGFVFIDKGYRATGSFFALRLVDTNGVKINGDIQLSKYKLEWNAGQILYGNFTQVSNEGDYGIIAYPTGTNETTIIETN